MWCTRRESNPHERFPEPSPYHWTTNAEPAPKSSIPGGAAGVEPARRLSTGARGEAPRAAHPVKVRGKTSAMAGRGQ